MTETQTGPTSTSGPVQGGTSGTTPAHAGPLSKLEGELSGWFHKHDTTADDAADLGSDLADHATTSLSVASEILAAAKLIDPADTALLTAFESLIPKVLTLAESGLKLARNVLHGNSAS